MHPSEVWIAELERPTEGFFAAYARRIQASTGMREAVREALGVLIPRVDWAGYLPGMPHGLLGLWGALCLGPWLDAADHHRLVGLQLLAFARTGRALPAKGLQTLPVGSGLWACVERALASRVPDEAWGAVQGLERVTETSFEALMPFVGPDMANVGHKVVALHRARDLFRMLDRPPDEGRLLLGWAAWMGASEPVDTYWHDRMVRRMEGLEGTVPPGVTQGPEAWEALAEVIETRGLVATLDGVAQALRNGWGREDLLGCLVTVAARKLLDARPDMEGKTGWPLVYLATLAETTAGNSPAVWGQAAALINLYPSDDPEDRRRPVPWTGKGDPGHALEDAIRDGEPERAMGLVLPTLEAQGVGGVLKSMASTVASNDPGLDQSGQVLLLAAVLDLWDRLPETERPWLLQAVAKSLACRQTDGDAVRRMDRALETRRGIGLSRSRVDGGKASGALVRFEVGYEGFHGRPDLAHVVGQHVEIALGPREILDVPGQDRFLMEAQLVEDTPGCDLAFHHLGDDLFDAEVGGELDEVRSQLEAQTLAPPLGGDRHAELAHVAGPTVKGPVEATLAHHDSAGASHEAEDGALAHLGGEALGPGVLEHVLLQEETVFLGNGSIEGLEVRCRIRLKAL